MKKISSLLITNDYPPIEGGIAGSLSMFWALAAPARGLILAPGVPNARRFDRASPNPTIRFPSLRSRTLPAKLINLFSLTAFAAWLLLTREIERLHCGQLAATGMIGLARKLLAGKGYYLWAYGGETRDDFLKLRILSGLRKKILDEADMIITNSPFTSREFIDKGYETLEIVPGVDGNFFSPGEKDPALIEQYQLQGKRVLLTCGRLVERKGHDRVIGAMAKVLKEVPEAIYLIVGDGPYRDKLEDMTDRYGLRHAVRFVGMVDFARLPDYYNSCDIFVMPNRAVGSAGASTYSIEGLGMVFLEAAACGKPVIGGDSGGAVFAVNRGVNGFLVPSEDEEGLARAIVTLLTDCSIYKRFSRAGLEHVKNFSWEKSAEKLKPYL